MIEPKIGICHKETTCYECTELQCWKRGDIVADCQAWMCIYPDYGEERCFTCKANEYAVKKGTVKE